MSDIPRKYPIGSVYNHRPGATPGSGGGRATGVTVRTQFVDINVRAALRGLGDRVAQNVIKRSMRKALEPIRSQLKTTWLGAAYRGKPLHRKAIASATKMDIRRNGAGPTAAITGRVGVMYGKGGGVGAGGRQKIWHLLEAGYRHYAKGSKAYANFSKGVQVEQQTYQAIIKQNRPEALKAPKSERSNRLRAVFSAARVAAPAFVAERTARASARKGASSKQITGAWRSRAVIARMLPDATHKLRDYILQACKEALNGRK